MSKVMSKNYFLPLCRVPDAVLQKRFSDVSKKLLDLLVKNANSESTSLIKSVSSINFYLI